MSRRWRVIASGIIAFGALLVGMPANVPAATAAVAPDTVVVVDRQAFSVYPPQRQIFRPPADIVQGYAHTLGPPGWATVEVDFGSTYIFAYAGATNLVVGQTYTHVKSFWNPARTQAEPATHCDDSTFTIHSLTTGPDDAITSMSWDLLCGGGGLAYTVRIDSTDGYQLLESDPPSFGEWILPGQSIDTEYTIHSIGTLPLVVETITVTPGAISIIAEDCTDGPVAPGDTCTATLRFAPTTAAAVQGGWLEVTSGTVAGRWAVTAIGGTIDPIVVTPVTLDLGSSPATVPTASQTITVSFDGIGTADVTGFEFQGDGQADFTVTGETCTAAPIEPGGSCTVDVAVAPLVVGPVSGSLFIRGDPVVDVRYVALRGSGTDPITIAPAEQSIGVTLPGGSVSGNVVLSSVASVDLPVSLVEFTLSTPAWSIAHDGCSATGIPAGGSCTITVKVQTGPVENPNLSRGYEAWLHVAGPGLLGSRYAHLYAASRIPDSAVTWSFLTNPNHRWNFGNALARAVNGSAASLVEVFSSDRSGSHLVSDTGAKMPVAIARSTNGGATWGSPVRVNPTTQHGIWPVTAAAGKYVSVAWASATKVVAFSNTAPRVLYVRTNPNSGSGTWSTIHQLTSSSGRIDHPSIAADGSTVAIAYTDSKTGAVRVAISKDHGATWTTATLGSTSLAASWGKTGLTTVAVTGPTVAVAWIPDAAGSVLARISTNGGTSWGAAAEVATGADDGPSLAASGGRVGLAWTVPAGPMVRTWAHGSWSTTRILPLPAGNGVGGYTFAYDPVVAMVGSSGVGVAWSECFMACGSFGATTHTDLLWSESATGGVIWSRPGEVNGRIGRLHQFAEGASVVWASPSVRYLTHNAWYYTSPNTVLYFQTGVSAGFDRTPAEPRTADRAADALQDHRPMLRTTIREARGPTLR